MINPWVSRFRQFTIIELTSIIKVKLQYSSPVKNVDFRIQSCEQTSLISVLSEFSAPEKILYLNPHYLDPVKPTERAGSCFLTFSQPQYNSMTQQLHLQFNMFLGDTD